MRTISNIFAVLFCGLFFLFFANVVMGSIGLPTFLSDIQEMLLLFSACICFVVLILHRAREAARSSKSPKYP